MMMVYIKPLSRFPELSSDKIFGALTSVISEIYPESLDEMISSFESNNPPFLVSSAFPVILDDNEKIRCYPKINRFIDYLYLIISFIQLPQDLFLLPLFSYLL